MFLRISLLLLVCAVLPVHAAEEFTVKALSLKQIDVERERLEKAQITDEEQRKQALTLLEEARELLQETEKWRQEKSRLENLLKQKKIVIEGSLPPLSPLQLKKWKRERLEKELALRKQRLEVVQEQFDQQEKALTALMASAKTGGGEIAETRKMLEETRQLLANITTQDPLLSRLQRLRLKAREKMLEERLAYLTLRQNNIVPLVERVQKRRDLLAAELKTLHSDIERLQDLLQLKQESKASKEAEGVAAKEILPPVLQPLQEEVTRLATENEEALKQAIETDRRLSTVKRRLNDLKNDLNHIRHIVEVVGNEEAVASLLLKRLGVLPSVQELHTRIVRVDERINEAEIRQLVVEEWLRENSDFDAWSKPYLEQMGEGEKAVLRRGLDRLWEELRATRQSLLQTYTNYISKLSELEATLHRFHDLISEYRDFLQKQLIWIPTANPFSLATPELLFQAAGWVIDASLWHDALEDGRQVWRQQPVRVVLWLFGVVLLLGLRRQCLRWLKHAAQDTRRVRTDSFSASGLALLSTLVLASPLALVLMGAGWLLAGYKGAHEDMVAIAQGLMAAGQIAWLLSGLAKLTRKEGLARRHLRWSEPLCRLVHAQAVWLRPLMVPLTFVIQLSAQRIEDPSLLALGRLAFNVSMVLVLLAIHRIWHRKSALMRALADRPHGTFWLRFHAVWFLLLLAIPLGLILESVLGYYYMALLLTTYLFYTFVFILILLLVRDLLLRWLAVVQRRIRFEEILRRHQEVAIVEGKSPEELPPLPESDELDYSQLSDQVRQLVQAGFLFTVFFGVWFIWHDLVPAFNIFGDIQLPMTTTRLEKGIVREVPLTLGDVLTGLLLGGLTLLAARKLPALLELTLLQALPLARPSCYAIRTLSQYLVVMIGIILTFKALGLRWSSIQWLVAALSVGLGFGLQEVVANFVSGVILLFEQPIRVGDVVTVDGVTGTVAKIRIRATTIVNWDRQELVIPNKTFITSQLINWTLSDTITRIIVTLGIAYGSDVEKAMALMREAAEENPRVLKEPAPLVTFEEFGDNALTFRLRAYLDDVDIRLSTTTDLHKAINEKFERAGIVIAFPQRDVHLDTARPLEIVLRQNPAGH